MTLQHIPNLSRFAAFTTDPAGGNRAGVWLGDAFPDDATMQAIAAKVGYSETVFAVNVSDPAQQDQPLPVRYFSPEAEVPFCGHATIALGAALLASADEAETGASFTLDTISGGVNLAVSRTSGIPEASLTSVEPSQKPAPTDLLQNSLKFLNWEGVELDPNIPPVVAYAGAHHLVIAVAARQTLAALDYDFDNLKQLMIAHDLTTLQLVWRQDSTTFHARNPFPVGGVVEDPATGAAAAALGGYLRALGLVAPDQTFLIHQGNDMLLPSELRVTVPAAGGIVVSGNAVEVDN